MQKIKQVRKSPHISHADFSTVKANHVHVGKKYSKSGNVCLGIQKTIHGNSKPWRFGKNPLTLHPFTYITIADQGFFELETQAILKYIKALGPELRIIENRAFKGLQTKSYLANLEDLIDYCKENTSLKSVA
jgi:hypothetical protein